ncbi:hypothetical protein DYB36_003612 [Aphanomyces astaci]|uniref:Death domain-containing protein n=1 Tax=Aphanomyces astaci TaxID=112090 RepID=A0A397APU4_APHAT|nr:hypothetical protein DYB36_003612 [Aphanomyces astaci]
MTRLLMRRTFATRAAAVIDEELKTVIQQLRSMGSEGAAVLVTPDHVTKLADTKTPATLYQMGQAIFENSTDGSITQSVLLWQTAAAKGHLNAKYSYAQCLKQGKGELKADPVAATAHFRQLYEAKHAWGTYGYAEALNVGDGIRPNKPKAFELYMACARSDLPPAYMAVANMYASGEGVAKVCEALEWYHKAAAKGDAHAKSILGDWYFNGVHNVVQNVSLGLSLRQEAARAGVPNALFNMGCLYRVGDHVEKDEAVAYQLFQQAAIKGHICSHGLAIFNVALMLRDGVGVPPNKEAAKKWLQTLAPHDIQAKEMLDAMD